MATPDEVVALVQSSPRYVAAHDKAGWVGIFADDFVIEDPVGWTPVTRSSVGRFWDAFIAPNDIHFAVHRDWIDGLVVVRDVTVETTLRSGVLVRTPAILRYECAEVGGELKVIRMSAFWDAAQVFGTLMRPTLAHVRGMTAMSVRMLRVLGLAQTLRFARCALRSGRRPRQQLTAELAPADVAKCFAAGGRVAATATLDGRPVAVLARFDPGRQKVFGQQRFTQVV